MVEILKYYHAFLFSSFDSLVGRADNSFGGHKTSSDYHGNGSRYPGQDQCSQRSSSCWAKRQVLLVQSASVGSSPDPFRLVPGRKQCALCLRNNRYRTANKSTLPLFLPDTDYFCFDLTLNSKHLTSVAFQPLQNAFQMSFFLWTWVWIFSRDVIPSTNSFFVLINRWCSKRIPPIRKRRCEIWR